MAEHQRRDAVRRSTPSLTLSRLGGPIRALQTAVLFSATVLSSCGDGGSSSNSGGSSTSATAGQAGSSTTSATAGSGGTSGTSGSTTGGTAGQGGGTAGSSGGNTGGMSGGTGGMSGGTGGMASTGGSATGGAGGSSNTGVGGTGGAVGQGGTWVSPPLVMMPALPPPTDYSGYPVDDQGRPIVMQGSDVSWVVNDTPDALTARDLCAQLVSNCFEPGVRSLDACFMSAPHCVSATPWTEPAPCCADACFTAYAAERTNHVDPLTAYLRVLYDTPICMPGVDAKLGGQP